MADDSPTPTSPPPGVSRSAALAAIEARNPSLKPKAPLAPSSPGSKVEVDAGPSSSRSRGPERFIPGLFDKPPSKPVIAWKQDDKWDTERRKELSKAFWRGLVRDNGYGQVLDCVETLIKIGTNILDHTSETKYQSLKAENSALRNKVLALNGGHEYLILMGFRTKVASFEKTFVLEPSLKSMHGLKLAVEILQENVDEIRARTSNAPLRPTAAAEEAARKARALREYEDDRENVKQRVQREKFAREAREAKEREEAAAAAAATDPSHQVQAEGQGNESDEDDQDFDVQDEDDDEEHYRFSGQGVRLGSESPAA